MATMMIMIPILVTLVGIVTAVSDVHDQKAPKPNDRISVIINISSMIIIMITIICDSDHDDDDTNRGSTTTECH